MHEQTPLCVGIIGCGYQGGILAQAIGRTTSLQVTACADPDHIAAARVAKLAGNVAVYASIDALLQAATVDAVIIATPHDVLYETALAALHAGKHVLAEKPIGMDEKEAAQLEIAVQGTDLCFMAGYSFRYIAAFQKVHALVQANAVGEMLSIAGAIGISPMSSGWEASPETGGGPLLYVGSHLVDAMLWYLQDDPIAVVADVCYRADTRADETTAFQIQFARGAVAQGMVTQTASGFFNNLDMYGRQGRISLRGNGLHYTIDIISSALPAYTQLTTLHIPQIDDLRMLMLAPQLAEFAQAIQEHRQPAVTVTDGRRVLKVLDAIIKSDRTGEPVRIG
ncbi:MAG: Gfo/Idh/MocA family oxidoreductase [Chloroflexota bacterium]|nr:Gfo/Idh/MocA family oxidoreductase [Chloroflexota bacterium]